MFMLKDLSCYKHEQLRGKLREWFIDGKWKFEMDGLFWLQTPENENSLYFSYKSNLDVVK